MQLHKPAILPIILLVLMAMLVLVACGGSDTAVAPESAEVAATEPAAPEEAPTEAPEPTATPLPEPTAEPEPTAAPAEASTSEPEPTAVPAEEETAADTEDALTAVQSALVDQFATGSWRVIQDVTSSDMPEGQVRSVIEYVTPDRFRVTLTLDGETLSEAIIIGDTMYQNLGGTWMEVPVQMTEMLPDFMPSEDMFDEAAMDLRDVEFIGTEELNGESTRVFRYVSSDTLDGATSSATVTVWVRESDNLPVQQIIEAEADGVVSTIIQTIEYDPNITIEPPQ